MTHKNIKNKLRNFTFWMFGFENGGVSCSFAVLHGGLGINKLQFLYVKKIGFFSVVKFYNFWPSKPRIRNLRRIHCGSTTMVFPYLWLMPTVALVLSPYFWVCAGPALVLRPAERDRPLLSHHIHLHLPLLQATEITSHHPGSEFFPSRIRIFSIPDPRQII